jgi:hypothetical protein
MVADEQELSVGVVHDIVNLLSHELMQDGYSHGAVGQRSQEGHSPLAAVASAEGNLVAFHHAAVLEQDMQLLDFSCYIMILKGCSLVVGQRIKVPVVDDALLYKFVETGYVFHNIFLIYINIV